MVRMNILNVGTRRLRYVRVNESSLRKDTQSSENQLYAPVVLFFGSDVLAQTSLSSKNISREHFTRSKLQQCCKVSFSSRLLGITGHAQEAWFYDVKGLMSVAFHCYTFEEQRSVVKCLFTEWNKAGGFTLPAFVSFSEEDVLQNELTPIVLVDSQQLHVNTSCDLCENEKQKRKYSRMFFQKDTHAQTVSPRMATKATQYVQKSSTTSMACQTNIKRPSKEDEHDDTAHNPLKRKSPSFDPHLVTGQFLNTIATVLKDYFSASSSNIFFFKVYSLFETFLFVVRDELQLIEATTTGIFPFHLMFEYANFKKQYRPQNTTGLPANVYFQDVVLQIYSKWLGTQYHKFQSVIGTQIEEYKKTLISQNKFLPSSAELLGEAELYPSYMVEFLKVWLHGGQQREEQRFQSSELLLVLELMNDNLITGVGHVVYAKLKSSDSV